MQQRPLTNQDKGRRADKVVSAMLPKSSYSFICKLFRKKCVVLDGRPLKVRDRLPHSGLLRILPLEEKPRVLLPNKKLRLPILHRDPHLLIINKPPRRVMSPGPGHGTDTILNGLLAIAPELSKQAEDGSYGLVHRLDKDTSGALLVALDKDTRALLVEMFSERQIHKCYQAIVEGLPDSKEGIIDAPLTRLERGKKKVVVSPEGRPALTHWRLKRKLTGRAWLEIEPKTGRTHQVRAHLAHINHPICGDPLYGEPPHPCDRQMLHAWTLRFKHPQTGQQLEVEAPLPDDFKKVLKQGGASPRDLKDDRKR